MAKKKQKKGTASVSDILGGAKPKKVQAPEEHIGCVVCLKEIPAARLKALREMNTPLHKYTHTHCSTVTKIKGLYLGEVGTSEIMFCDKIYNDSVRSVFRSSENKEDEDED